MKNRIRILLTILILFTPSLIFCGELTSREKEKIGWAAEEALKEIISLWKNEKFEELYECGYRTSHSSISKETFIRQMKNKYWGLALSWETIQDVESDVVSPFSVYVKAKIGFKKKTGGDTKFATETFNMIFDGGRWRTGLYKILSCPN